MNLKKVDALKYVKSHPEIFINYNGNIFHELTTRIASDAITLGCTPVTLDFFKGWWIVGSKMNWFEKGIDFPILDLFVRLVPHPKAGQNESRNEILLNAYAENVNLFIENKLFSIKGECSEELLQYVNTKYKDSYLVAFN